MPGLTLSIALALAVFFVGAMIKTTLGFGESLLCMPLLTMLLGVRIASPLVGMMGAFLTLLLLLRNWQRIDLRAAWQIALSSAVGIPIGVWGLSQLPSAWVTLGLGVVVAGIGLFYLFRPTFTHVLDAGWGYAFGFSAGVLAGAYNTGGPPVVIFGTLRRWPPETFRVTLQGCFLPASLLVLLSHAAAGLWTPFVLKLFALSLPALLVGGWLGTRLARYIPLQIMQRMIYIVLVALGSMLLYQSLRTLI